MSTTKKELLEQIEQVFETNNKRKLMFVVGTALTRILQNQTDDEKDSESTRYVNGTGFTGVDGNIGTSMAFFFKERGFLTPKQVNYWMKPIGKSQRPRILKYRKQLLEFALEKQQKVN